MAQSFIDFVQTEHKKNVTERMKKMQPLVDYLENIAQIKYKQEEEAKTEAINKSTAQNKYFASTGKPFSENADWRNVDAYIKRDTAIPQTRKVDKMVNDVAMTITEQYDPATKTFKEIGKIPKYKTGTATKDDTLKLENEAQKKGISEYWQTSTETDPQLRFADATNRSKKVKELEKEKKELTQYNILDYGKVVSQEDAKKKLSKMFPGEGTQKRLTDLESGKAVEMGKKYYAKIDGSYYVFGDIGSANNFVKSAKRLKEIDPEIAKLKGKKTVDNKQEIEPKKDSTNTDPLGLF